MQRCLFYIDIDAFFASVEQRRRPWLRGRPVVVGGDPRRRGVVASASYEARRYGIRSAMPLTRAKRLCPRCVFLPGDFAEYESVSSRLFLLLDRLAPGVEPLSIEEARLDLSGSLTFYGHPLRAAEIIREEIRRALGLTPSIGIASIRVAAKIASARAKPNGILYVLPGHERSFLAPLPVRDIPGVGPRTAGELTLLGVRTIGDLADLGERLLVSAFGRAGSRLHEAALAVDGEPRIARGEVKSVSREVTFPEDILSRERIRVELSALTERCCRALRREGKQAGRVTVKLRYADFSTVTRSRALPEPTNLGAEIFPAAARLLRKAWTRRIKARLVGIHLSRLTGKEWQPRLRLPTGKKKETPIFDGDERAKLKRLYAGCDRIVDRYGPGAIISGRIMSRNTEANS